MSKKSKLGKLGEKSMSKTRSVSLAEIHSAYTQSPEFGASLSGNQEKLLGQLVKETKDVDHLSDRDRGCWNSLIKKFDEFKAENAPANGSSIVEEMGKQADVDVKAGADMMNELDASPAPEPDEIIAGDIVYHEGRDTFGKIYREADMNRGELIVRFQEEGRGKWMPLNDKWTKADAKQTKAFEKAANESESPAKSDPNDMVDVSVEPPSKALVQIGQAIDGEIVEMVDVLETIGPDEDLSAFGDLSSEDQADLIDLEGRIFAELPNWEKSNDVLGAAFAEINSRKLFRATHKSFVKYIFDSFQVTRAKAYQLMITAEVKSAITNNGNDPVEALPSQRAAQTLNQITQEVKGLLGENHSGREIENYDRMLHKFLWEITLQSAPRDEKNQPIVTPGHLESVKETIGRIIRQGVVSVDGEDHPIAGLHSFVDNAITEETTERTNRMKQGIVDNIQKGKTRRSEPQERVSVSSTDGKKMKNTVRIECSEHGDVGAKKFVFGGMVLSCGCAFVKVTGKDTLQQTDIIE